MDVHVIIVISTHYIYNGHVHVCDRIKCIIYNYTTKWIIVQDIDITHSSITLQIFIQRTHIYMQASCQIVVTWSIVIQLAGYMCVCIETSYASVLIMINCQLEPWSLHNIICSLMYGYTHVHAYRLNYGTCINIVCLESVKACITMQWSLECWDQRGWSPFKQFTCKPHNSLHLQNTSFHIYLTAQTGLVSMILHYAIILWMFSWHDSLVPFA